MIVQLGDQVVGTDGKLGKISGFSIDSNSQTAEQMVVQRGLVFHSHRLAVLGHITSVETGVVHVDLRQEDWPRLEEYDPHAYRREEERPMILPPFDKRGPGPFENLPEQPVNPGFGTENDRLNDGYPMSPTFPENEADVPEDKRPTVISEGMPVLDNSGNKVAGVQDLAFETASGTLTRITLRHELAGQAPFELPLEWIERYAPFGIVLNVSEDVLQMRAKENAK